MKCISKILNDLSVNCDRVFLCCSSIEKGEVRTASNGKDVSSDMVLVHFLCPVNFAFFF